MTINKIKRNAFTIVELLVSIMIIGILSSLGYQQYTKAVDTAKAKGMTQLIKKFNTANADYLRTYGEYPITEKNQNLINMLKAMEFKTEGTDVNNTLIFANLGPRTTMHVTDIDSAYPSEGTVANKSTFRYIIIRNVPSRIASEVAKEINGKVNNGLTCQLAGEGFFVAIQRPSANMAPDATNCIPNEDLVKASGGHNQVDIFYTFSRSLNSGSGTW